MLRGKEHNHTLTHTYSKQHVLSIMYKCPSIGSPFLHNQVMNEMIFNCHDIFINVMILCISFMHQNILWKLMTLSEETLKYL